MVPPQTLSSGPIPRHVAIIMHGNRRWAKQSGLPTAVGHARGTRRVRDTVQACADRGVRYLSLFAVGPEMLIRTGGESRISNFMLWQLAYTDLYFTEVLWPRFSVEALDAALQWYGALDRRFGGCSAPPAP